MFANELKKWVDSGRLRKVGINLNGDCDSPAWLVRLFDGETGFGFHKSSDSLEFACQVVLAAAFASEVE